VARNAEQYRTWLEFIGEVLQQPLGLSRQFEGQLLELLTESFNGALTTRNTVTPEWENKILDCWPRNYIPTEVPVEPPGGYDFRQQPLLRWFAFSGDAGPQTFGRVPDELASSRLKQAWEEVARPWGVNHQLAIPLQIGDFDLDSLLISRPDRDFTEQEFDLAKLLHPILTSLTVHFQAAQSACEHTQDGSAQDLTAREMTVLSLLSEGLTADALGRRLGISPRTAGKHLEHIYRKLDVCDRLMAVQRARDLGLPTTLPDNFQVGQPKQHAP
jgi:DNA-binding CsgD family transcriptional regulator